MDKKEFLQALEAGLGAAAPEERVSALQYYTEYLDEAGPEHEAEVLAQLGSPSALANEILSASGGEGWTPPARVVVTGPPDSEPIIGMPPQAPALPPWQGRFKRGAPLPSLSSAPYLPGRQMPPESSAGYNQNNNRVAKIVLAVLLAIFLSPVWGMLFGVLFFLLACLAVVFFVPLIMGFGFTVLGVVWVAAGGVLLIQNTGAGLVALGSGITLVGLGLMAFFGGVALVGRVLPAAVRWVSGGIKGLWRKIFPKSAGGMQHG